MRSVELTEEDLTLQKGFPDDDEKRREMKTRGRRESEEGGDQKKKRREVEGGKVNKIHKCENKSDEKDTNESPN